MSFQNKIIYFFLICALFSSIFVFSCKKNEVVPFDETTSSTIPVECVTQFIKGDGGYLYTNAEDVNVPIKNLDKNSYLYLNFGSKVTVLYEIIIGKDAYYKVQLPDTTQYWALKTLFTEKFIVINKPHVNCYKQPDTDYVPIVKVQPGDFGYFVKELNGWILVDFYCTYRPYKEGGDRTWVGQYWINGGYTDDVKCAKQAYYLSLANHRLIQKKNQSDAISFLHQAIDVTNGENTEITYVISDLLNELESNQTNSDETTDI